MIRLSVLEIEGGTLSVTEEKEKKEKDWSWSILVVGFVSIMVHRHSQGFIAPFTLIRTALLVVYS